MNDLNAIEQAGLLPLLARYRARPLEDRDTAAVGELRADGNHLLKLTIDRLPAYAHDHWERLHGRLPFAPSFSFPADS